jgi:hypothetical protein
LLRKICGLAFCNRVGQLYSLVFEILKIPPFKQTVGFSL